MLLKRPKKSINKIIESTQNSEASEKSKVCLENSIDHENSLCKIEDVSLNCIKRENSTENTKLAEKNTEELKTDFETALNLEESLNSSKISSTEDEIIKEPSMDDIILAEENSEHTEHPEIEQSDKESFITTECKYLEPNKVEKMDILNEDLKNEQNLLTLERISTPPHELEGEKEIHYSDTGKSSPKSVNRKRKINSRDGESETSSLGKKKSRRGRKKKNPSNELNDPNIRIINLDREIVDNDALERAEININQNKSIQNNEHGYEIFDKKPEGWVQCSKCSKWRKLLKYEDLELVDFYEEIGGWFCGMPQCKKGPNYEKNPCEEPEDHADPYECVYDSMPPGSLVLAKMNSFPYWPAIIDVDVEGNFCTYSNDRKVHSYLITFLDEKSPTFQLVDKKFVKKFKENHIKQFSNKALEKTYRLALDAAKLSLTERIFQFGYPHTMRIINLFPKRIPLQGYVVDSEYATRREKRNEHHNSNCMSSEEISNESGSFHEELLMNNTQSTPSKSIRNERESLEEYFESLSNEKINNAEYLKNTIDEIPFDSYL